VRILFINQYFAPDAAASARLLTELSVDLADRHDVDVIAGRPSYDPEIGPEAPSRPRHRLWRTPSCAFRRHRVWFRLVNYASFGLFAFLAALVVKRPDLVVAGTDPPLAGTLAMLVGRLRRVPFVLLHWDIHPHAATAAGVRVPGRSLIAAANRRCLARADGIVAPTAAMARATIELGADPARVTVIPHWEDTAALVPQPKDNAFSRALGLADRFVVMYSGNIGLTQRLDAYVGLAERLRDLPDVVLLFVGGGAREAALLAAVRRTRLETVRVLPYQRTALLPLSLASADVFLVPLGAGLTRFMLPSKVYTCMAAARPVLAAIDPDCDVAEMIRAERCGHVVAPGDLDALERHVRDLHAARAEAAEMGRRGRAAIERRFARSLVTARYSRWLDDVVTPASARGGASSSQSAPGPKTVTPA
jgi:glycosyltransferase involved in cell wall biosynthesis